METILFLLKDEHIISLKPDQRSWSFSSFWGIQVYAITIFIPYNTALQITFGIADVDEP